MASPSCITTCDERPLDNTPTWAVAVVCFVLVGISIFIEQFIHHLREWLWKKQKRPLYEALEKIKSGKTSVCFKICNSPAHIFIFVLAVAHVLYCITTLGIGKLRMRTWRAWEDESRTIEYQFYNDPERFRFARDTSFGCRHLHFWSNSPILLRIVCFFRQFYASVEKVDYLTLRHGFVMAHLAPQQEKNFDFQLYINRALEEDFTYVVGISPVLWLFAVLYFLTNTNGWYSYYWLPFIPLIILLVVGTKLQVIITKMGLKIQERGEIVKGTPLIEPGDYLFWFNRPALLLFLIHFVLFQNAYQLAFFAWSWCEKTPSRRSARLNADPVGGDSTPVVCSIPNFDLNAFTPSPVRKTPGTASKKKATGEGPSNPFKRKAKGKAVSEHDSDFEDEIPILKKVPSQSGIKIFKAWCA